MDDHDALLTRETLLQRVRRERDEKAWSEFSAAYGRYIYNLAIGMGLAHHDAQEVGQNVMLQLWKKLPDFEYDVRKGRFRAWLCAVTSNEVKMLIRSRTRDLNRLDAAQREQLDHAMEASQKGPDAEFAEREWVNYITTLAWERVRDTVGEKERIAFELVSEGRGVEDVATTLNLTSSSVYVYKKRVQDLLTKEIVALNCELD
jgi:RNA polymerase sigma factor (sigma-70 family)